MMKSSMIAGMWSGAVIAFGLLGAGHAEAQPFTSTEQAFLNETYPYAHPSLTDSRLVDLGHQACSLRRSGLSSDGARDNLSMGLMNQGILSTNAEVGSLVHSAVDTLCPEVGYP